MAGFNRHGASDIITLPLEAETATARPSPHATAGPAGLVDSQAAGATGGMGGGGVADATLEGLLFSLRESRRARNVSSINTPVDTPGASRPGLAFLSRRSLVPTAEVRTDSWRSSGIGDLLPFQDRARRLETRYQVSGRRHGDSRSFGGGIPVPRSCRALTLWRRRKRDASCALRAKHRARSAEAHSSLKGSIRLSYPLARASTHLATALPCLDPLSPSMHSSK
eukprot:scaffold5907_cov120-Isochrysis_galbana.AAC.10